MQQQTYYLDKGRKNKIQPSETTFSNFSDNVAVLRGHENCCRFATLLWREHLSVHRRVMRFWIDGVAALWQNYGMSYKKNTEVELLPVVGLFQESAFGGGGRCNTGVLD